MDGAGELEFEFVSHKSPATAPSHSRKIWQRSLWALALEKSIYLYIFTDSYRAVMNPVRELYVRHWKRAIYFLVFKKETFWFTLKMRLHFDPPHSWVSVRSNVNVKLYHGLRVGQWWLCLCCRCQLALRAPLRTECVSVLQIMGHLHMDVSPNPFCGSAPSSRTAISNAIT